jgi:hypothetical protein
MALVGEQVQVPAQRIHQQMIAHQSEQAFEALAHVDGFHCHEYLCGRSRSEHCGAAYACSTVRSNCASSASVNS